MDGHRLRVRPKHRSLLARLLELSPLRRKAEALYTGHKETANQPGVGHVRGRDAGKTTATRLGNPPVVQIEHLSQFLVWLIPAVFGFSLLAIAAFLVFRDVGSGLTGATLFVYGCSLLVARTWARRGKQHAAVSTICFGFLVATIVVVVVQPTLVQVLTLSPLLAVGVALPYATERTLRLLFAMAWLVAVAVTILSEVLPVNSALPRLYDAGFRAASLITAISVVLLLLWQFRSRLVGTLTQVQAAEKQAMYDATHDALTDLPNRTLLEERLKHALEGIRERRGRLFAVLFLDLDRFKNVNDSLGHVIGDQLLIEVARRLKACVHPTDTVARLGGDEFTILLENLETSENAIQITERIQETLKVPFRFEGHELYTGASVGVVLVKGPRSARNPEDLLRDADTAMYWAKERGKASYAIFDEEMRTHAVQLLRLEMDLRRAVEQEEFVVHYQPIVALSSGRIVAFEALVRWQHPERGLVAPANFVALTEETGLIIPITMSVLREACFKTSLWRTKFPDCRPLSINVNLTSTQLGQSELVDQVGGILRDARLEGRHLRLEITEGGIMRDAEQTKETLSRLRNLGVRIHIDDFGTGYSSLAQLHQFPVDALKIDQSFIGNIDALETRSESAQITQTITTLAHSLGMDVIAEGVQTREQLKRVRSVGCNYAQGFFFSEPVDAQTAEGLLSAASLSSIAW